MQQLLLTMKRSVETAAHGLRHARIAEAENLRLLSGAETFVAIRSQAGYFHALRGLPRISGNPFHSSITWVVICVHPTA